MYNIIMTSLNKIKLKYLIQVWQDVMKIIKNVKNVNAEKVLWWCHHWNEKHSSKQVVPIT